MITNLFGELLPENINGGPYPKELTTTPNSYCHPEKFFAAPLMWEGCI